MKKSKREKLEAAVWKIGDASDFLNLSNEEVALFETKRALTKMLREVRVSGSITQEKLAEMIESSQSRVAKMEAASSDVSLDLLFRALFALGVSRKRVGRVIGNSVV